MTSNTLPPLQPGWALFRRELNSFFQTPVAYVVGVVFLAASAALFFSFFFLFDRAEMRQFFRFLPLLLAVLMPALAMRVIAEERRRGMWEVVRTLPVRTSHIVLAKFAAVWVTGLFLLAPTVIFVGSAGLVGSIDPGPVIAGYLGAILLAAVYGAIGVFASSISRNETVALVVGLVISLVLGMLNQFVILFPGTVVSVLEFLSTGYHFDGFTRGVIDTRSVVYLLTLTAGFLILSRDQLDRQR
ncbi:MAG: ABC transporter permease [Spirochaetota bacterium]